MRKIHKPTEDPKEVYLTCISRVRNSGLKRRLESIADEIEEAAEKYDEVGRTRDFYRLSEHNDVAGIVTQDEMEKVYTERMVPQRTPGRKFYDKIKAAPSYGICPLCGQRPVSTLDHYLPKSIFPSLAVTPYNLIPACSDCNKIKSDDVPTNAKQQTIHPYYDHNIEAEQWLFAEILRSSPVSIKFFVNPPEHMDDILKDRIKEHFKVFDLASLYASQSGVELANIRYRLNDLLTKAGSDQVREHLQEEFNSRYSQYKNSWQTAMYQAMANSTWFYSGGFNQ